MDSRYIFLREDFDALNQAITDNGSRVRVSLEQTGCSQDGGDTWHDNFEYEEGQRGAAMWSQRVKRLNEIRAHAELFVPDPTGSQVFLGRTVTVEDQSTSEKITYLIASYMVLAKRDGIHAISYASPLAVLLRAAKVGDLREGHVGKIHKRFKIIDIK